MVAHGQQQQQCLLSLAVLTVHQGQSESPSSPLSRTGFLHPCLMEEGQEQPQCFSLAALTVQLDKSVGFPLQCLMKQRQFFLYHLTVRMVFSCALMGGHDHEPLLAAASFQVAWLDVPVLALALATGSPDVSAHHGGSSPSHA